MKVLIFASFFLLLESVSPLYSQGLAINIAQGQKIIAGQGTPSQSSQGCTKDGIFYPSGTVLDGMLCSNGEWIPIPPS